MNFRALMCWLGNHPNCITEGDDKEIWGECVYCHKRFGVISRDVMRREIDRELAARATAIGNRRA